MEREETRIAETPSRWHIDLDRYKRNNRSFYTSAGNHLCPGCAAKFATSGEATPPRTLLKAIKDCCSLSPDFITEWTPVMTAVFSLFLANGNQPLTLEEIGQRLSERRGGDTCHSAPEILSRLLNSDRYYGFSEVEPPRS